MAPGSCACRQAGENVTCHDTQHGSYESYTSSLRHLRHVTTRKTPSHWSNVTLSHHVQAWCASCLWRSQAQPVCSRSFQCVRNAFSEALGSTMRHGSHLMARGDWPRPFWTLAPRSRYENLIEIPSVSLLACILVISGGVAIPCTCSMLLCW